jgi:Na+-transporting methylmalonyl-CoA/oxaloacetate decarboxylase gamma subunit
MENIGWGLQMTVLGMGLVFAPLALLWLLLTVVLKLDKNGSGSHRAGSHRRG